MTGLCERVNGRMDGRTRDQLIWDGTWPASYGSGSRDDPATGLQQWTGLDWTDQSTRPLAITDPNADHDRPMRPLPTLSKSGQTHQQAVRMVKTDESPIGAARLILGFATPDIHQGRLALMIAHATVVKALWSHLSS